jgi:hypothetical protein
MESEGAIGAKALLSRTQWDVKGEAELTGLAKPKLTNLLAEGTHRSLSLYYS